MEKVKAPFHTTFWALFEVFSISYFNVMLRRKLKAFSVLLLDTQPIIYTLVVLQNIITAYCVYTGCFRKIVHLTSTILSCLSIGSSLGRQVYILCQFWRRRQFRCNNIIMTDPT